MIVKSVEKVISKQV